MKTEEELDLVETDDLADALRRRFKTFIFVGIFERGNGRREQTMWWGGNAKDALHTVYVAQNHLIEESLDQQDDE